MSFESMKSKSSDASALINKLTALDESKKNYKDDRFWSPTVDDAGNGAAVIRFLPDPPNEDAPFVLYYSHAFQGPGGWYIENSRTTLGESDPVSDMNKELWNSGRQEDKDRVSQKTKRKKSYVSNILVLDDPGNPENNGKVFLYRYGVKIHQKIQDAMQPDFADEEAIIPFDFWKGANFKLRIRKVANYRNYDKSEFGPMSELYKGDDEKLKALWESQYPLSEFVDPANYKSYDELKSRLQTVLGGSVSNATAEETTLDTSSSSSTSLADRFGLNSDEETESEVTPSSTTVETSEGESEEDALSYFEKLAAGDDD